MTKEGRKMDEDWRRSIEQEEECLDQEIGEQKQDGEKEGAMGRALDKNDHGLEPASLSEDQEKANTVSAGP